MKLPDDLLEAAEHDGKDGHEVWLRCRLCGRRGPHEPALLELELDGRARMARARLHAGTALDRLDVQVLEERGTT